MYWQARHDNRHKQSTDIYPSRIHGYEESDKRAVGNGGAGNGRGTVQRERIFVLQPGAEAAEGAVVGEERVLAGASYPLGTQRLERDKFPWPETEEEAREISAEELTMLLAGIDFFKAHKTLYYKKVS